MLLSSMRFIDEEQDETNENLFFSSSAKFKIDKFSGPKRWTGDNYQLSRDPAMEWEEIGVS